MRSLKAAAPVAACFLVCACSEGLYSATAAGDGYVVVMNRASGDVRVIRGDTIEDLKPPAQPTHTAARSLTPRTIPDQPVLVRGSSKFRDGSLLLRISITPAKVAMSDKEWISWRVHIRQLQDTASLRLEFVDEDDFEVVSQLVPLSTMTQEVDYKGDLASLSTQVNVAVTQQNYGAIRDWVVGWNGVWPAYVPPPAEGPMAAAPKPKT